jgi:magnesium and cobalt transporter
LDEYGGTAGLVALENILEEIVGEAFEGPQGPEALQRLQTQGLRLLGRARIRELNRRFQLGIPTGNSDTIGGYLMSLFGDVPQAHDRIDDGRLEFRVLKVSGRRIDALLVRPLTGSPGTDGISEKTLNEPNNSPDL